MANSTTACPLILPRRCRTGMALLVSAGLIFAAGWLAAAPAFAQQSPQAQMRFPERPKPLPPSAAMQRRKSDQASMLLKANELHYDYTNNLVSAVGNVQVYFNGATLLADKFIYNQKTKRLRAEGNVQLTEADGSITYGQVMDLSDDFRDGFVDALRLDTLDQTRMAGARADRSGGKFTVF